MNHDAQMNERCDSNGYLHECQKQDKPCTLGRELISVNNHLSKINNDLEQFIQLMSHDLRAPLVNILGFTNVLKESCWDKLSEKEKTYLMFVSESTGRLSELMDDLLEYSKISICMHKEEVFLDSVCDDVLKRLSFSIKMSEADISVDPLPMVYCNKTQIGQVFQNLIGNSVKYRKKGDKCIIHIGCHGGEKGYCFYVEDNGIGIPESYSDNQSNIFGAFKRVIEYSDYEGNGIGLAICKKIIDNHDGSIWFESERENGTTFYFTLPVSELPYN